MKKTLILVILFLMMTNLFCQTNKYRPFPDSNAIWDQSIWYLDGCCQVSDDQSLYISGDTTIGPYTYHKLYINGYTSEFCPPPDCGNPFPPYYHIGDYWGAFRQDTLNKRVYLYQGKDTLAYDFNLNVGDQIHSCLNYCGNSVHSIDSVLVGNKYTKRFWLSCNGHNDYVALIEGIGSTYGAFASLLFPFESGSSLGCVKENNQTIWPSDIDGCALITNVNELSITPRIFIYPNPATDKITIEASSAHSQSQLSIMNLNGQELITRQITQPKTQLDISSLPSGVYFVRVTNDRTVTVGKFVKQ
jgi:hypothetical protein